jgi:hypothetical protein
LEGGAVLDLVAIAKRSSLRVQVLGETNSSATFLVKTQKGRLNLLIERKEPVLIGALKGLFGSLKFVELVKKRNA